MLRVFRSDWFDHSQIFVRCNVEAVYQATEDKRKAYDRNIELEARHSATCARKCLGPSLALQSSEISMQALSKREHCIWSAIPQLAFCLQASIGNMEAVALLTL